MSQFGQVDAVHRLDVVADVKLVAPVRQQAKVWEMKMTLIW